MKAFQKPGMSKRHVSNSPSKEGLRAEKALKMAVAGVIEEHRRLGLPIAVMRGGKAVFVSVNKKFSAARETKASYRTKR
jgi:hypothetical protein